MRKGDTVYARHEIYRSTGIISGVTIRKGDRGTVLETGFSAWSGEKVTVQFDGGDVLRDLSSDDVGPAA